MPDMRHFSVMAVALFGLALSGCVAAVSPSLTVIPGQGKTFANLQADDAICRGLTPQVPNVQNTGQPVQRLTATGAAAPITTTAGAGPVMAVTADQYYACMGQRGEYVVQETPEAYPAYPAYSEYAVYPYPAYSYPYPYPYPYPYYPYGLGYPYSGGYFGPSIGVGVGFGFGRFYGGHRWAGGGWHGGGWRGGGFRDGWRGGGGWHGGGGWRGGSRGHGGGGFHR